MTTATHLRLVKNELELKKESAQKENSPQLSFPFNGPNQIFIIHQSEISYQAEFIDFLTTYSPKYFFDLRLAPRMDLIAGSRVQAFEKFNQLNIEYLDICGRAGVPTQGDFLEKCFSYFCEIFSKENPPAGPHLFIFDNDAYLKIFYEKLANFFDGIKSDDRKFMFSTYQRDLMAL